MTDTLPRHRDHEYAVAVDASVQDDQTGALWVHKDLVQVKQAWDDEAHIGPPKEAIALGDVESWATYVNRFAGAAEFAPLVTWNSEGLKAILDYHSDTSNAGRLWWVAKHPFDRSPEWKAWMALADGHAKGQRDAIEALEDRGAEIVEPTPAELMNLLRTLRVTVNKSAQTELRPDGSTSVQWMDDKNIAARGGMTELPSEFTIAIPVLKGHVDADGKPVVYALKVRVRATVNDQARLALRFTIPSAERALESVFADRVAAARAALGDQFEILRAAG